MLRAALTLAFLLSLTAFATAGPGHDHGDGGNSETAATASIPRLQSSGDALELVATADGHRLTIYLDRLATNAPVDGAAIEVSGAGITPANAEPLGDGVYALDADWIDVPGRKALVFTVIDGTSAELLNGTLEIPATPIAAPPAPLRINDLLGRFEIWILAALAAAAGFVLSFAVRPLRLASDQDALSAKPPAQTSGGARDHFKHAAEIVLIAIVVSAVIAGPAIADAGHDHGDGAKASGTAQSAGHAPRKLANGDVFVPKPAQRLLGVRTTVAVQSDAHAGRELVGTVISDPSSEGKVQAPMDGEIELSTTGVPFAGQSVEAGHVLAYLAPSIPVFDRGSLQQLTAEVEGKLKIAEQRLARLTRIADVVPQKDIEDTRAEVAALREQKRVLAPKDAEKIALKAPVSGIISVARVRAGQVVTARDTLFEIVDPKRLWIEAIDSAGHGNSDISAASARDTQGHAIALRYIGRSPTLRQQAMPLLFDVVDTHDALTIGAPVTVTVQRGDAVRGVVLPDEAIVRGTNGLPHVWAKVSAETFAAMPVRTAPLDGARVLVTAGIEDGSRIVTDGAELINQVR
ncbi:MAG TPA: HlyD family efflux transporter periplasmic adaptor subunit [Hyphomicrobium sp.]|nr:HlyD family efflux transporter periplasmic adaptor subunit [Hyphomicrobium sp.]